METTNRENTASPRPEILDEDIEETLAEHQAGNEGERYWQVRCSDLATHGAIFDGTRLYCRRVELGLSRADVEDRLLDAGFDVTVDTIAAWERALDETSPRGARAISADVFLALPRILGGSLGDFVNCWTCNCAAHPERFPEGSPTRTRIDPDGEFRGWAGKFVAARERLGLSREQAAVLAAITPRQAELLERAKGCVSIDAALSYFEALGVEIPRWMLALTEDSDDGDRDEGDEPVVEPLPDDGAVREEELVAAA
jgi:transcriptional regulator with XRE-family HTH domain